MAELKRINPNPNVKLLRKAGGQQSRRFGERPSRAFHDPQGHGTGTLKPGMKLIEPTSGNTGIALAMIAAVSGFEMHLVMPESATAERVKTMRAYGAVVHLTPADEGMEGTIDMPAPRWPKAASSCSISSPIPTIPPPITKPPAPKSGGTRRGRFPFRFQHGHDRDIMGVSRYSRKRIRPSASSGRNPPTDLHPRHPPLAGGIPAEDLREGAAWTRSWT